MHESHARHAMEKYPAKSHQPSGLLWFKVLALPTYPFFPRGRGLPLPPPLPLGQKPTELGVAGPRIPHFHRSSFLSLFWHRPDVTFCAILAPFWRSKWSPRPQKRGPRCDSRFVILFCSIFLLFFIVFSIRFSSFLHRFFPTTFNAETSKINKTQCVFTVFTLSPLSCFLQKSTLRFYIFFFFGTFSRLPFSSDFTSIFTSFLELFAMFLRYKSS